MRFDTRITNIVERMGIKLVEIPEAKVGRFSGEKPYGYYDPVTDEITIVRDYCKRKDIDVNLVLLHELGHAIGHPKRLNRPLIGVAIHLQTNPKHNREAAFKMYNRYQIHEEIVATKFATMFARYLDIEGACEFEARFNGPLLHLTSLTELEAMDEAVQALKFIRNSLKTPIPEAS